MPPSAFVASKKPQYKLPCRPLQHIPAESDPSLNPPRNPRPFPYAQNVPLLRHAQYSATPNPCSPSNTAHISPTPFTFPLQSNHLIRSSRTLRTKA
ncbi:hypothetical protein COCSADRAFT_214950 [Bipolaris sorokiniana ND90Pr]|uniref:Uncharacterized protein n=1 Tax=Cochliobolus sativus (strain ND90Pr / ATCC 201652) TaxID=665912 RepID=M2RTI8_COCSN|nr:uncharacterized protein COCSADRAFT_214950 [Bipolaris sorokiniana ND90Pr]EMD69899.1 hypothetical protein COCSADRAFT_214950 [Bipolaris sorokiniana ND90Pr]